MISVFWVFLLLIILYGVWAIDLALLKKTNSVTDVTGTNVISLYSADEERERALLYVDLAARKSIPLAIEDLASSGGLSHHRCGKILLNDKEYAVWKNDEKSCIPGNGDLRVAFGKFLNDRLNPFLQGYPENPLPTNNYDVTLDGSLSVHGIAQKIVTRKLYNDAKEVIGQYSFYPSFTIAYEYDLSGKYALYRSQVDATVKIWRECMERGSSTSVDADDAITCRNEAGKVRKALEQSFMDAHRDQYVLVFEISDDDSKSVTLRCAEALRDDIPPPLVEDMKVEMRDGAQIISWSKNAASDVDKYEIFASESDFTTTDQASIHGVTRETSLELGLTGEWYVAIVAVDGHGNRRKDVKTVHIDV